MSELIYLVEEGKNDKYKNKVCKNKIPYISFSRKGKSMIYSVDLSFVGAKLSEVGERKLKQRFGELETLNDWKNFSFLVQNNLTDIHNEVVGFISQENNLEDDLSNETNFDFHKMRKLLKDNVHWQYWQMLQDYANFRRNFEYYKEALEKISPELNKVVEKLI